MKEHLVILDMQENFLKNKPSELVKKATSSICKLVDESRRVLRPVTFTLYLGGMFGGGRIIPELWHQARQEEIITKTRNSAFRSPQFVQRVSGSDLLYIVGCNLEFCIIETIKDGLESGMEIVAYKNAILSRDTESEFKTATELYLATAARCLYKDFN